MALWKEQLCVRLDIEPLLEAEVEAVLEVVLGAQVAGSTRRWLWEITSGNPLYLREVVLAGLEAGHLVTDGVGRWAGAPPASARLAGVRRVSGGPLITASPFGDGRS